MYDMKYNGKYAQELGLKIASRPNIPTPKREYKTVKIEGRDGDLHIDKGTYEDIEISIEFGYMIQDFSEWCALTREIKKWLCKVATDNKLILSDDAEFFYKVKSIESDEIQRIYRRTGKIKVTFVCDPYIYLNDGEIEIPISNSIYNAFEVCKPVYKITGEGVLTLTVNGKSATINVGQNLTIDTNLKLCYRDGATQNTAMTGDFNDLVFKEGENALTYTSGFNITVIPNWRAL
jgi:predicted phage tail component-like protein